MRSELLNTESAEAVVRELMKKVIAEQGLTGPLEVRALSSGGGNFTSALFTASVGGLKVFAKVAIMSASMRKGMNAETYFKTEIFVYNNLIKTYNNIIKKHEAAKPFRFPKIYASLPDLGRESLVLEDLLAQGYRTPSRQDPIDWRFASAAITKLATFHALSFAYESEYPEEFATVVERFKYKPRVTPDNEEMMKTAWMKIVNNAIQIVKEQHRPNLMNLFAVMEGFTILMSPISRTILAHGGYRINNLMCREQDGFLDVIVLDYQTVHSGSPASDLLYFIFLSTDHEFRQNHYKDLLQLYHRELSEALNGLGLDVEKEYPKQVFEKEVKKLLPSALHMAAVVLPVLMVDEAAAPQVSGDADFLEFLVEPNQLFAERFAGIVADCVDWGVI